MADGTGKKCLCIHSKGCKEESRRDEIMHTTTTDTIHQVLTVTKLCPKLHYLCILFKIVPKFGIAKTSKIQLNANIVFISEKITGKTQFTDTYFQYSEYSIKEISEVY